MPFRRAPSCATGPQGGRRTATTCPRVHHNTLRRRRVDTHALALVRQGLLKLDVPVDQGIERIVPAHAHVDTWLPARATLPVSSTAAPAGGPSPMLSGAEGAPSDAGAAALGAVAVSQPGTSMVWMVSCVNCRRWPVRRR